MPAIVRKIDRLPFWAWPPAGAAAGVIAGGILTACQVVIGALL